MTTRRRTAVLVALVAAAVALGASAIAGHRGTAGSGAPPEPEVTGGPAAHTDPDYWTDDRMREAKPAPMPAPPEGR